jgi:2'-5' RNA ligase
MRLFLAIPVEPLQTVSLAAEQIRKQMQGYRIKWTKEHQFHLTLFFFGDTNSHYASLLSSQILKIASQAFSFPYTLTEPGIFTSNKQPQVLWLGVDAPAHLKNLKKAVDKVAVELGFKADNRPFRPHLTLGRFRPGQPIPPPSEYRIAPNTFAPNTSPPDIPAARNSTVHTSASSTSAQGSELGAVHFSIACRATRLVLYESRLTPSGPIYKTVCEAPLKT